MKRFLISIFLLFVIFGCGGNEKKSIEEQICPQCNMPLVSKKDSAKAIRDNETVFFWWCGVFGFVVKRTKTRA